MIRLSSAALLLTPLVLERTGAFSPSLSSRRAFTRRHRRCLKWQHQPWSSLISLLEASSTGSHHHHHHHQAAASSSLEVNFTSSLKSFNTSCSSSPTEILSHVDEILANYYPLDREATLAHVDLEHAQDAKACESLVLMAANDDDGAVKLTSNSSGTTTTTTVPSYRWIRVRNGNQKIALQTTMSPILNATEVSLLRHAASQWWQQHPNGTSRFTYQRPGNQEVHLVDLLLCDDRHENRELRMIVSDMLLHRVFPLVQEAFFLADTPKQQQQQQHLHVYDALVIRYNSTAAIAGGSLGAGQPLHRDLGLVSVNVMLNDDYQGGGTLMELQLLDDNDELLLPPLKPLGVGHALVHESHQRHAGVGTTAGVRDILVLFLTTCSSSTTNTASNNNAPARERAARIKGLAQRRQRHFGDDDVVSSNSSSIYRAQHYRYALEHVPDDGEAWQYLGLALLEHSSSFETARRPPQQALLLRSAVECFLRAVQLAPCDGRLYNNLGLALEKWSTHHQGDNDELRLDTTTYSLVRAAYERSLELHRSSKAVGCDVEQDLDAACLNYGLYLANQDRFQEAAKVLQYIDFNEDTTTTTTVRDNQQMRRVKKDAENLLQFCLGQIMSERD